MKKNCEKGTIIACHSGDVMVLAGCKILSMISTFHDNSTYTGTSAGEEYCSIVEDAVHASRTDSQSDIAIKTRLDRTKTICLFVEILCVARCVY
ncbi:hypothetical protein EVAR_36423_1 [Eumeta japonica]|uniref:Uncharacterized protein n=1 Tax=Eumeta variegata TaxID=151549 RepID=A0A4C1VQQ4_EUMVA|nr:hypothetical protein EVAR_36423_1 [Eumeta japonica]